MTVKYECGGLSKYKGVLHERPLKVTQAHVLNVCFKHTECNLILFDDHRITSHTHFAHFGSAVHIPHYKTSRE